FPPLLRSFPLPLALPPWPFGSFASSAASRSRWSFRSSCWSSTRPRSRATSSVRRFVVSVFVDTYTLPVLYFRSADWGLLWRCWSPAGLRAQREVPWRGLSARPAWVERRGRCRLFSWCSPPTGSVAERPAADSLIAPQEPPPRDRRRLPNGRAEHTSRGAARLSIVPRFRLGQQTGGDGPPIGEPELRFLDELRFEHDAAGRRDHRHAEARPPSRCDVGR